MYDPDNKVRQSGAGGPSILAVDDTPANLLALSALISPMGHELVTARSGFEALAAAAAREFAVILLDVMMPELDGFATLERLRALPLAKSTPVLFLTAYDLDAPALERAYTLGAIDYIAKPIAPHVLRGKLSQFVALHQKSEEIRQQAEALIAKDRHIGVLAHDLRNPLQVLSLAARRLEGHEDTKVRSTAGRIARSAERMERLADDLLESARLAAGQFTLKRVSTQLTQLCRELVDDLEATYPRIAFAREFREELTGSWDPARLQQALSNLLANAVKYGTGWVSVRLERHGELARVTVENGGELIPAEQIDSLFQPFKQGHDRRAGVGLGLYIVREIARAHGGDVRATSDAMRTTFVLELPLSAS